MRMLLVVWAALVTVVHTESCSRGASKIVRKLLEKKIYPIYSTYNVSIAAACPLLPDRDVYGHQINNKFEEASTKWVCNFCGKSFQDERYLDMHFDNRHPDSLRTSSGVVCLADYCDIFRCDIAYDDGSSAVRWDQLLCSEGEIQLKMQKCLDVIQTCVSDESDALKRQDLFDELNETLCSYLTCGNYWMPLDGDTSPVILVFYIVGSMILALGLVVYFMTLTAQLSIPSTPELVRSASAPSETEAQYYAAPGANVRYRRTHLFDDEN